jgi:MoxR-like ATPase
VISPDPKRRISYIASPLVSAMLDPRGAVFLFDEINRARPIALTLLASVLDSRRSIDCTLVGGRVTASNQFYFLAAANANDLGSAPLPAFLDSRLRPTIRIKRAERAEIDQIVKLRYGSLRERLETDLDPLLDRFWSAWRALDKSGRPPTARDTIGIFALALGLRQGGRGEGDGNGRGVALTVAHIEEAVQTFCSTEVLS